MKMDLFIPDRINVGFQKRSDTYSGRLAYIIYYDSKGVLRKEVSWQNWRDKNIPNEEFDNVPTEGFVLNKRAGGVEASWGWNARKTYTRIYDPRGFEFEITIENLLYILENTNSIKGKGLEGQFVYAWSGKDLVLLPCSAVDYTEQIKFSNLVKSNDYIKAKDLIIGATYLTKDNIEVIYMGKFDQYCYGYWLGDKFFTNFKKMTEYADSIGAYKEVYSRAWLRAQRQYDYTSGQGPGSKTHWFYERSGKWFIQKQSISQYLLSVVDNVCVADYSDLYEKMQCDSSFSPIDESATKFINHTLDSFKSYMNKQSKYIYASDNYVYSRDVYVYYNANTNTYYSRGGLKGSDHLTIEQLFDLTKPVYYERYLKNGKLYERKYA